MAEVKKIRLLQPVIITACGVKSAGDTVTQADCGESWNWVLNHTNYEVVDDSETEVVVPPVEPDVPSQESTHVDAVTVEEAQVEGAADLPPEPDVVQDVVPDATETTEVVLNEGDAATVEAVKSVLASGKSRLKDLLEKTGLTEEVVSPVLTEANGFYVNQQGWYGLVKS